MRSQNCTIIHVSNVSIRHDASWCDPLKHCCWIDVIDHFCSMCRLIFFGTVPFFSEHTCVILSFRDDAIHLSYEKLCRAKETSGYTQCDEQNRMINGSTLQSNIHIYSDFSKIKTSMKKCSVHTTRLDPRHWDLSVWLQSNSAICKQSKLRLVVVLEIL